LRVPDDAPSQAEIITSPLKATTMKFKEERPLANPEAALAKLLEIANALEADHAGRLSVGAINHAFLDAGGNGAEYGAAMHRAVAGGWMEAHPSGAYVKLKRKDADKFA
jgi:hypothetical protein